MNPLLTSPRIECELQARSALRKFFPAEEVRRRVLAGLRRLDYFEPRAAAETDVALEALTSHWMNLLASAWECWGAPAEGVLLDHAREGVLPRHATAPNSGAADWGEIYSASWETLLAATPLEREDVYGVGARFKEAVVEALARGERVQVTGGLEVVLRGEALYLVER
jgi:hypothetical protein